MPTTYEPIATNTLGTATNTVTFSSIPTTYTDLRLIYSGSVNSTSDYIVATYNGDTGANYSYTVLYGDGTSASSFRASNSTYINVGSVTNTTLVQTLTIDIMSYKDTTFFKTALSRFSSTLYQAYFTNGLWRSTAAINSVTVKTVSSSNFNVGATFTLYGIKAA